MEGKKTKTMGWVERFGEQLIFNTLSLLPLKNISKPHNPKPTCFSFLYC
jgi:hypothetical protein